MSDNTLQPISDLGPITTLYELPTKPTEGSSSLKWLDTSKVDPVLPTENLFDMSKPPEGIEFLALLNEIDQLFPDLVRMLKGEEVSRYVSSKIEDVQKRISTLYTKKDPFEECESLKEALRLLAFTSEVTYKDDVIPGYNAAYEYKNDNIEGLSEDLVKSLDRLKETEKVSSII